MPCGAPETAIEHFARAMRLSPLDSHIIGMQAGTAFAHMLAGRYDEASCWAEKAMWAQNYVTPLRIAVASHALAGRLADAKKVLTRLRELDPGASIANFCERAPLRRREDRERLESGLRRAGMPEN
jgi:tetratricopeptide (TPR) repeat protein